MAISKEQKESLVGEYRQLLGRNSGMVLASYSGLSVKEFQGLRAKIREIGGEFRVVKNTLASIALEEAGIQLPKEVMEGTTAIGFANEEVTELAKAMVELAKESEALRIKCGWVNGALLEAAQVTRLADLPPLPVLQARLIGLLQAPAARLASLMAGPARQVAGVIGAYARSEAAAEGSSG